MTNIAEQGLEQTLEIRPEILEENNAYAAGNRQLFKMAGVFVVNVMGSPGSGKTTLLERILRLMQQRIRVAVIEGDLTTAKDARRLSECGVSVVQISANSGGYLSAKTINKVLPGFYLEDIDLLVVENVGNLVSPPSFDLGEDLRMVVMSIAEASDKPGKYPTAFRSSQAAVLNKMDMLDRVDINLDETEREIVTISPDIKVFHTSCRKGEVQGVDKLANYLIKLAKNKRSAIEE